MTSFEFNRGYENLERYFRAKPNDTRADVWYAKLQRYPVEVWDRAVAAIIDGERYFPTLGAVRALCGRLSPTSDSHTGGYVDVELTSAEKAMNGDLMPLFRKFLDKRETREEFEIQLCYYAKKHNLHGKVFKNAPCRHCERSE